jgi:translation initiation factor IF-3
MFQSIIISFFSGMAGAAVYLFVKFILNKWQQMVAEVDAELSQERQFEQKKTAMSHIKSGEVVNVRVDGELTDAICLINHPPSQQIIVRIVFDNGNFVDSILDYQDFHYEQPEKTNEDWSKKTNAVKPSVEQLQQQLDKSIADEDYKQAAWCRDEIKKLKKQ